MTPSSPNCICRVIGSGGEELAGWFSVEPGGKHCPLAGWGLEKQGLVGGIHAHGGGLELDGF